VAAKLFPVIVLVCGFAGPAAAQVAPPADPDKLVTRSYDLKPILGARLSGTDLTGPDDVVRLILETLRVGELKPGTDGPQVVERDGGKLEVRATEKVQGEIKDLLDALGRLADVAVDVKADVVELDRETFEKVRPLFRPGKGRADPPAAVALPPAVTDTVIKRGKVIQSSSARYANGAEAVVSARQSVLTYSTRPAALKPADPPLFVKEGFRLLGLPVVSADRRSVRLKLTEKSAEVVGVKKREIRGFGETGTEAVIISGPEVSEYGRSGTVEVEDGGAVLFKLDYAPKDKVWVVVLRPTIFIRAEEDERKRQEKE
jgi:hypothetical protein